MRRMFIHLTIGLALYAGLLILSQGALDARGDFAPTVGNTALALLPMIGAAYVVVTVIATLHRLDEMQRKIQFDAFALAFLGTAVLTFGYGFLEGVGLPKLSMFVVWPIMAALWLIGTFVGRYRYT
ncbi:hypothetical protein [Maritimibacter dapengensis]|uniref:Uncharacterized protein n=1 Tax=Maritimibacter dapengensis TaxID=2836868 RepID=A0ABS6T4X6_9RHOB|nr:hypothetical protein [Maritimibacter dapengensis]MBV7380219.1 hypothetical protein [Maritimibacter dapengensis]